MEEAEGVEVVEERRRRQGKGGGEAGRGRREVEEVEETWRRGVEEVEERWRRRGSSLEAQLKPTSCFQPPGGGGEGGGGGPGGGLAPVSMVTCDNSMAAEHRIGRGEGGIEGRMRGEGWGGRSAEGGVHQTEQN